MFNLISKELILEEFALAVSENDSHETVKRFMKRYPEYAEDIMDYAVALLISKHAPAEAFLDEQEHDDFLKQAQNIFSKTSSPSAVEISSLDSKLHELNIGIEEFRKKTGLTRFVLHNLDQKLVDVSSIPPKVVRKLSEALKVSADSLNQYLSGGFRNAHSMNFKAFIAPTSSDRISFEEVLNQDPSLTDEERSKLLENDSQN
jgi:hypothetical protein